MESLVKETRESIIEQLNNADEIFDSCIRLIELAQSLNPIDQQHLSKSINDEVGIIFKSTTKISQKAADIGQALANVVLK